MCRQQQQKDKNDGNASTANNANNNSTEPKPTTSGVIVETTRRRRQQQQQQQRRHCRPPPALQDASCLSRWSYAWAWPLLKLGLEHPLQDEDLPHVMPEDSSRYNRDHVVLRHLQKNSTTTTTTSGSGKDTNHLFWSLVRDYFRSTWFAQLLLVISMLARIGQALALQVLLDQLERNKQEQQTSNSTKIAYGCAAVMTLCGGIVVLAKQRQFFITYRTGMQQRIGVVAALYDKALKLPSISSSQQQQGTAGQVLNLASNDAERFLTASVMGLYLVWGPLEAMLILVVGMYLVGPVAFSAGFGLFLLVLLPLQWFLSRVFARLRQEVAVHTDDRIHLVSQIMSGQAARMVKMNAWQDALLQRIAHRRAYEMTHIRQSCRWKGINEALYFVTNIVVAVLIFTVHIHLDVGRSKGTSTAALTPGMVFSTLTLINILQFTMTKMFPFAVMTVSEAFISSQRIQHFLELPELHHDLGRDDNEKDFDEETVEQEEMGHHHQQQHRKGQGNGASTVMDISGMTCHWNMLTLSIADEKEQDNKRGPARSTPVATIEGSPVVALNDITLTLQTNRLYGIMGVVGGGKSSLLQALAGELPLSSGTIRRQYTSMAYASQDPWIMNGSIRDNITLGLPLDHDWYQAVVTACALQDDIQNQFRHGDNTVLGDKGVQCSGGQKARIGLARAVYRDPQVLLLDDPMSAVDVRVGAWIYREVILGLGLKRGKCVVLATHQIRFLQDATTYCILMEGGRVKCSGSYMDCIEASHGAKLDDGLAHSIIDYKDVLNRADLETGADGKPALVVRDKAEQANDDEGKKAGSVFYDNTDKNDNIDKEQQEERNTGVVKLSTWIEYANAMGGLWVAFVIFGLFVLAQASSLVSMAMIGKWAEQPEQEQASATSLSIVVGLTAVTVFIAIDRAVLSFHFFNKASQRLHDRMTEAVLFAKISFFDINSSGRILNRFSADVGIADEQLPLSMFDCLVGLFMAFGSVATAITVLPVIMLALPPLLWYLLRVRGVFVTTTRELKRLEGLGRSPIFEMISEALIGIATMRTNGALEYFRAKFEAVHDAHTRAFFAFVASSRWFATRLDLLTFLLMAVASFATAILYDQGWFNLEPSVLGLALTLLLQLAGTNFPWMVRQSAEVVNQMVSVERVSAFGKLPSESAAATECDSEHFDWPKEPSILVKELTVKYRDGLPPALRGVSFKINARERVGVIGRTGSGKSTLVQALFRLLEADEGTIEIGGVDISRLGLRKLRCAISVIPQFPVLFRGYSVRENLDPFSSFTDEQVWNVLDDVQMSSMIRNLTGGLGFIVSEGGSNFSVGQRQLLCLARAILSKSSIVVLDEATANIDSQTEASLSHALSKNFADGTVIAIAHRLDTVRDFDRILVLGDGRVLEYGSPEYLLTLPDGHYASLVKTQNW